MSSYIVLHKQMPHELSEISKRVPMMLCHGRNDDVVPFDLGVRTRNFLTQLGYTIDWKEYPSEHRPTAEHIKDIAICIRKFLRHD